MDKKAILENLLKLNSELWDKAHELEFRLLKEVSEKKRNEKLFAKRLLRLSKYLDLKGVSGSELQGLLKQQDSSHSNLNLARLT